MTVVLVVLVVLAVVLVLGATTMALRAPKRARHQPPVVAPRRGPEPAAAPTAVDVGPDVAVAPPEVEPVAQPEPQPEPEPEPEVAPEPEPEPEVVEPITRARLRDRLGRTRSALAGYVRGISGRGVDQATWDDLEEALLLADVGLDTTARLLAAVQQRANDERIDTPEGVVVLLREAITKQLDSGASRELACNDGALTVWMFVGVNGVGKTTTIGKLAAQQAAAGRSVMLAAGDTFRAAAAEQLSQWAERTNTEIVRGEEGADPGSVVFDAMSAASSRGVDLLLVDTAGRLHTKNNLMAELEKLKRIVDRTPGALREVLLVIDASTGQNGLLQAKQFAEAVDVTGIALTKLDGTAKGGIVLAIHDELDLPVKLVGIGEQVGDLVEFDPEEFTAALFE